MHQRFVVATTIGHAPKEHVELLGTISGAFVAVFVMRAVLRMPELRAVAGDAPLLIAVRLLGAIARYTVIVGYYGGRGDALRYHAAGLALRDGAARGDWSEWALGGSGTHALEVATAVFGAPAFGAILGEFFIFAAFGFVGLSLCAAGLRRSVPTLPGRPLLLVMLCWPSLVFWPSSVGKEAIILISVGLMTWAVVQPTRPWAIILGALGLAFIIRPHVAGLEAVGLFLFDTVSKQRRASLTVARLAFSAFAALYLVREGAAVLGVDPTELESVTAELQYRSDNTNHGGSAIGGRAVGLAAIPVGLFNVLFRPLPFEANGLTMLIAAAEVSLLWAGFWRYRRSAAVVVREWRRLPYFVFGLAFGGLWATLIGVTFVNMGILARQRTLMMPFLVAVLAAAVALEGRRRTGVARARSRAMKVS